MNKLNVVWILGEAIRNYEGDSQFSRYKFVETISKEGIFFDHIVATAPSTVMSHSSIMTSQQPGWLNRNYADFCFDRSYFDSLSTILQEKGYTIYATTHFAEGRKMMKPLTLSLNQNSLPLGVKNDNNWSSQNIEDVFDHIVKQGLQEPFFLLLNFNNENGTESHAWNVIKKLKKMGLYDNSVFLFNPDHGWHDHTRKKIQQRHDLILSDPNILIHCLLKFPKCQQMHIKDLVSSIDLVPTILDILEISKKGYNLQGESLLPLIQKGTPPSKKILRTDTRFAFQSGRSISLRGQRYKYIFHEGKNQESEEELYDLQADPHELHSLVGSIEQEPHLIKLRKELQTSEKALYDFQAHYLLTKFHQNILNKHGVIQKESKVLVLGTAHTKFIHTLIRAVQTTFVNPVLDVLISQDYVEPKQAGVNYKIVDIRDDTIEKIGQFCHEDEGRKSDKVLVGYKAINYENLTKLHSDIFEKKYDLVIVPMESVVGDQNKELKKILHKLHATNIEYINYNMTLDVRPKNFILHGLSLLNAKRSYYLQNPGTAIKEFLKYRQNS